MVLVRGSPIFIFSRCDSTLKGSTKWYQILLRYIMLFISLFRLTKYCFSSIWREFFTRHGSVLRYCIPRAIWSKNIIETLHLSTNKMIRSGNFHTGLTLNMEICFKHLGRFMWCIWWLWRIFQRVQVKAICEIQHAYNEIILNRDFRHHFV